MLTVEAPAGRRGPRPDERGRTPGGREARARQALGGEATLDEVIVSAWEGLTTRRVVACPVCASSMAPLRGSATHPVVGRCEDCGSRLI